MNDSGRILIADDDDAFRACTAELLCREGYACEHAADAEEAAQMIRAGGYDLLLAGLETPGNEHLELVRATPQLSPGLPVVVVTGQANIDSAMAAVQLQVAAYLVKPLEPVGFLDHVRRAVRHSLAYRGVVEARMRLEDWHDQMVAVENGHDVGPVPPVVTVDSFVSLTLSNIARSLIDLQRLASTVSPSSPVCRMTRCPRLSVVRRCLRGAVATLEQTKGAFKSRELGELRRSLEQVLTAIEA